MLNIRIENFEGPLDLLVHLVNTKKMDVKNIVVSQIIDDYLQIIDEYKENNFKLKVEFLDMASQLLEIKAYSILRKDEKNIQEEELEKRIIEHKYFQELSEILSNREQKYYVPYKRNYGKDYDIENIEHDNSILNLENIKLALKDLYKRLNNNSDMPVMKIEIDNDFTIENAYENIRSIDKKTDFSTLLNGNFTRNRIVCFFIAILELYKLNEINIILDNNNIYIERIENV